MYDAENRLVRASGATSATLAYDPLGRLWQVSGGSGTTRFVYDGDRLVAEYNASGAILHRYVHGPGVDEPVVWYEGAGVGSASRRYLHTDHQGSVVAIADAAGTVLGVNRYDPYGVPSAGNLGRYGYTGQTRIDELGLYYYKARIYHPWLGRFLQTDPIGYEDDLNLYAYVGGDPVNKTDPTGLAEWIIANAHNPNDPLFSLARGWNTPEFDIASHGDPGIGMVVDTSRSMSLSGSRIQPDGLVNQAAGMRGVRGMSGHGYQLGMPIRLGACGISVAYAAEMSRQARGALVHFTSNTARYSTSDGQTTTVTPVDANGQSVGWQSVQVTGENTARYTDQNGNRMNLNLKTGYATESQAATGTRIKQRVCVDASRCGAD